jgi:hypothetical protein
MESIWLARGVAALGGDEGIPVLVIRQWRRPDGWNRQEAVRAQLSG